jgi:hypothetical protein
MKIEPATIAPRIFSVHYPNGWIHLLGCERRIFKSGPSTEPGTGPVLTSRGGEWQPQGPSWERVLFPCLIELPVDAKGKVCDKTCAKIHYGIGQDGKRWTVAQTSLVGISEHAAAAAIAEAWRGVVESRVELDTFQPFHSFDTRNLTDYKNGTALWMLNAWLRWDEWNRRGYLLPQRAKQLAQLGYSVTPKQLKNAADVRAMPKALKDRPEV